MTGYIEISPINEEHRVYLAQHPQNGRIYVKKVMEIYDISVFEALKSRPVHGIPRITELYEDEDAHTLTVIEEYISGSTLETILREKGSFEEGAAVSCIRELCMILKEIHSFDPPIIHRDIKPSNVIVTDDGHPWLIDLNAGKTVKGDKSRDTRLIGTAGYAAPEQYGFASSGPATDIYAVGTLIRAMLTGDITGSEPYAGSLKPVIEKCRAMDPLQRYQGAGELLKALDMAMSAGGDEHSDADKNPVVVLAHPGPAEDPSGSSEHPGLTAEPFGLAEASRLNRASRLRIIPVILILSLAAVAAILLIHHYNTGKDQKLPPHRWDNADLSSSSDITEDQMKRLCGSYEGSAGGGLAFYSDGTAAYYCDKKQFSEGFCPWTYIDGVISVQLSKLHCVITARVEDDDFSSLDFTAEGKNWDEEIFVRISDEDVGYRSGSFETYDRSMTVQEDGSFLVSIGDMEFAVPSHFIDWPDIYDKSDDVIMLTDSDADTLFAGAVAFCREDSPDVDVLDEQTFVGYATSWAMEFLVETRVSEVYEDTVAGHRAYVGEIEGRFNKSFGVHAGSDTLGRIIFIVTDEKDVVKILMTQTTGRTLDDSADFDAILKSAGKQ